MSEQKKRVLIAEDVESVAVIERSILEEEGCEVLVVDDGAKCISAIEHFKPDLLILDIMMPKQHGIDVLKSLQDAVKEKRISVVICTAKSYKPDIDQAVSLGATTVIQKPFRPEEFRRAILPLIGRPSAAQEETAADVHDFYQPELTVRDGTVKLWGTRGSIPVSSPSVARHGGNTFCMSFETRDEIIIIDAGSGIRELGMEIMKRGIRKVHLFISHTHWDHIQGFPFFVPAYLPGFEINIYGASGFGKNLESLFRGQLDRDYFPIQLEDMRARMQFQILEDGPIQIGNIEVDWEYAFHPAATLSYKITSGSSSVVCLSDNEFLKGYLGPPILSDLESDPLASYTPLIRFLTDATLLIGEAQYTNWEYKSKIGWGHSSVSNACLLARLAGIRRWIVVHHDPMHDDAALNAKLNVTKRVFDDMGYAIDVAHGYDGMSIVM